MSTLPLPTFEGLSFREPTRADIPAVVAIVNAFRPPYDMATVEETEFYWKPLDPSGSIVRVVGETHSGLAAAASVRGRVRGDPDDTGYISIDIACEWRRRGLGTILFRYLEQSARELGMRLLGGWSSSALQGGEEFLTAMGMSVVVRGSESHLELASANLETSGKQAERLRAEGYEFFTLDERDTAGMRHEAHELSNYIDREMPTDGTPPQATSFEGWEKSMFGGCPGTSPRQVHLASMEGVLVGMTALFYQQSEYVYTATTGVVREHRGKGLAGALKYLSLTQALADGKRVAVTENSVRNAPMLAINRKMGYKHGCDTVEFEKDLK